MIDTGSPSVHIHGAGAAARAAARTLASHGIAARIDPGPAQPAPHLLLNEPTVLLLDDLFWRERAGCATALRAAAHIIRGRLVCWDGGEPELVEESGLAIAGAKLQELLVSPQVVGEDLATGAPWTIEARGRGHDGTHAVTVAGTRVALCAQAQLRDAVDPSLCAVEAVAGGWLFLLPLGNRRAVVQAIVPQRPRDVAATLDTLLGQSRLVAGRIATHLGATEVFPCAPRLRQEPARPGWIAAGDAAIAFDPLCGDGTGQGLRCGLLAGAVIAAIARGEPEAACLAHYRERLWRAMAAHLKAVIAFYEMAPYRELWDDEIAEARDMLDRITDGSAASASSYRLDHLALVRAPA